MTPEAAAELAAGKANQEASRHYGRTPFSADKGEAMLRRDSSGKEHWQWMAITGDGKADLSATVSFEPDGSQTSVLVQTLVSEEKLASPPLQSVPPVYVLPNSRF